MAKLHLRHPDYEGLQFGPHGEIKFGIRGGFAPGEAYVDEDDPLLPALLEAEPAIQVVRDGPTQVFVCPLHQDREFKTRNQLLSHMRGKGHEELVAPAVG